MSSKAPLPPKPSAVVTVVGAGFSGSTIAIQQLQHYVELLKTNKNLPPLTIRLIDRTGTFGPGLPYGTDDDVFIHNQPAYAMSPFPDDPDHFTRWLRAHDPKATGDTFATRHEFGIYLKETLEKAFADAAAAGVPVTLEKRTDEITDVTPTDKGLTLSGNNNATLETQALVLATGHQPGSLLKSLDGNPHYVTGVRHVAPVEEAVKNTTAKNSVAIVGTGQSMFDVLAVLDSIGYKGKVYALSRNLVLPWLFDPAFYRQPVEPYKPLYLDPAHVKAAKDQSAEALKRRFKLEIHRAEKQGYGVGHVLGAIDFDALATAGPDGTKPEGWKGLYDLWRATYGNPTPPQRFELLQRYLKSGRLKLVKGDVSDVTDAKFAVQGDGFVVKDLFGKKPKHLSAVFNAAAYDRNPLASPVLKRADEKGLLIVSSHGIAGGQQKNDALFVVGPPTSTGKWGVESFRDDNARSAKQSVDKALGLKF
jgi:hypothetical protein